jgi:hypothetical protein
VYDSDCRFDLAGPWRHAFDRAERRGGARVQDSAESEVVLLADGERTGEALTLNRAVLPEGSVGTPVHRHLELTESLFVIESVPVRDRLRRGKAAQGGYVLSRGGGGRLT